MERDLRIFFLCVPLCWLLFPPRGVVAVVAAVRLLLSLSLLHSALKVVMLVVASGSCWSEKKRDTALRVPKSSLTSVLTKPVAA